MPEKDPTDLTSGNKRIDTSKEVLTTPAVHLLAFFIFFYFGVEVTMGGTILVVVITTSFHTCTMQPDDGILSFFNVRVDRDIHH